MDAPQQQQQRQGSKNKNNNKSHKQKKRKNDSHNPDDATIVAAALSHLQRRGIDPIVARYERRSGTDPQPQKWLRQWRRRLDRVLQHTQHCWTIQRQQLRALTVGLECFRTRLLPDLQRVVFLLNRRKNTNPEDSDCSVVTKVLQHVFQWLLRLHDGYILIVSGECRHAADVHRAQQQSKQRPPLASQLNVVGVEDTKKDNSSSKNEKLYYSPTNTYSGTSWDEWNDSRRGLRQRLLQLLGQILPPRHQNQENDNTTTLLNQLWDDWIEDEIHGPAAALEYRIVQEAEHQMTQQLQPQFTELVHHGQFATILQQALQRAQQQNTNTSTNSNISVKLYWKDKMEQLHIASNGWPGKLQLARYASQFQIGSSSTGNQGALPLEWTTPEDWWNGGMQWPASLEHNNNTIPAEVVNPKKKRRIIADDDDSDGDTVKLPQAIATITKPAAGTNGRKIHSATNTKTNRSTVNAAGTSGASGLVVKITAPPTTTTTRTRTTTMSVDEIKRNLGINSETLRASRDAVEAEEAAATAAAEHVDEQEAANIMDDDNDGPAQANGDNRDGLVDENCTLQKSWDEQRSEIRHWDRRVKSQRRALHRILLTPEDDDDHDTNVWNARELLRETLLNAGLAILWSDVARLKSTETDNNNVNNKKKPNLLGRAIQYFMEAQRLVGAQEQLHCRMTTNRNSEMVHEDAKFYRRNLLLLRGQAQVNTGIARVEQARLHDNEDAAERRGQLERACQDLEAAVTAAQTMQTLAANDSAATQRAGTASTRSAETMLDTLRGQQLESLALRWKATAQWHLFQKPEAVQSFQKAAAVVPAGSLLLKDHNGNMSQGSELWDKALECRVECYHAWTTLADLASQSLERAPLQRLRASLAFYDQLRDYAVQGLTAAAQCSTRLETELMPAQFAQVCRDQGVLASQELVESLRDIQDWWQRRKESALQRIDEVEPANALVDRDLPRGEFISDGDCFEHEAELPTRRRRLVMVDASSKRSRRSKYNLGGSAGYSNVGRLVSSASDVSPAPPPRRFRKWCEDEYDESTGQTVAKLVYPSVAPEMPPHILAILRARHQQQQKQ